MNILNNNVIFYFLLIIFNFHIFGNVCNCQISDHSKNPISFNSDSLGLPLTLESGISSKIMPYVINHSFPLTQFPM